MKNQKWNAKKYQNEASFVARLGHPVLDLLNPQEGEKILDIGCGDGDLTLKIKNYNCQVWGIDKSENMIERAKLQGLNASVLPVEKLNYIDRFNAVFTNATLHWIEDIQLSIDNVYRSLKSPGRFIGEFGGYGNIQFLINAMSETFEENKNFGEFKNPWYFPSTKEFSQVLEKAKFNVEYIELIPRPTPLKNGINSWLEIFANGITDSLTSEQKKQFIDRVANKLKPHIYSEQEGWVADYVRIRFKAIKTKSEI